MKHRCLSTWEKGRCRTCHLPGWLLPWPQLSTDIAAPSIQSCIDFALHKPGHTAATTFQAASNFGLMSIAPSPSPTDGSA